MKFIYLMISFFTTKSEMTTFELGFKKRTYTEVSPYWNPNVFSFLSKLPIFCQKQSPEVFCKKECTLGLQLYLKRDSGTGVFL